MKAIRNPHTKLMLPPHYTTSHTETSPHPIKKHHHIPYANITTCGHVAQHLNPSHPITQPTTHLAKPTIACDAANCCVTACNALKSSPAVSELNSKLPNCCPTLSRSMAASLTVRWSPRYDSSTPLWDNHVLFNKVKLSANNCTSVGLTSPINVNSMEM